MTFCTTTDVLAIVDTDMTEPEVDVLIDVISAAMTSIISTGSTDGQLLRGICQAWVAYRVMLKDPNARGLGEYSERRDVTMKNLWSQVLFLLNIGTGGISFTAASESLS